MPVRDDGDSLWPLHQLSRGEVLDVGCETDLAGIELDWLVELAPFRCLLSVRHRSAAFLSSCDRPCPRWSAVFDVDLAGGIGFVCSRLYAWDAAVFAVDCSAVALDWLARLDSFSQT